MTTAVGISPAPILQFFNNSGQPNAGGTVLTQVGGVNYATYEDAAGTTPLPNPIPLNSRGEISNSSGQSCQLYLVDGVSYTFTLYDSNGNQINQPKTVQASAAANIADIQAGAYNTAADAGAVNALQVTLSPEPTSIAGLEIWVTGIRVTNTGATDLTVVMASGNVTVPVQFPGGSALTGGELVASKSALLRCNEASSAAVLLASTGGNFSPTAATGDNSEKNATTAFVQGAVGSQASPSVRQTVSYGATSAGLPAMLSAGTGLALNLSATAHAMKIAFAAGSADYLSTLSADVTGVVSSLTANALSYVSATYSSNTSAGWSATLAPPAYGYVYPQAAQSSLGLNNSSLDDFGNTWTNSSVTFANTSPAIAGTYYAVLNGTSSYMKSTAFTLLGSGGWALRGWVKFASLAALQPVVTAVNNSGGYGVNLYASTSGKSTVYLSSTGNSFDISNGGAGSATMTTGTWYFLEVTYDPVAGKYFVYVNGVLDQTITSSKSICSINSIAYGVDTASRYLDGNLSGMEFLPYCQHPNGSTYSVPTALPDITATGYASDWFDVPNMTMWSVTGASGTAGTNPTFTAVKRVYVGECVTGGSSVSSVTNYALNGRYDSGLTDTLPGAGTAVSRSTNIGTAFGVNSLLEFQCITAENGYSVGDVIDAMAAGDNTSFISPATIVKGRNTLGFVGGAGSAGGAWAAQNKSTGANVFLTTTNWAYRLSAQRNW